jgi:predicted transport protein
MVDQTQEAAQKMIANLKPNTGKALEQWHKELKNRGFDKDSKHGEIIKLLKGEYAVTHGYANLIAFKFREGHSGEQLDLVEAQYLGEKQALKPIYDKLMKKITSFGSDVQVSPKKAYVSLRRDKQFAIIQPSTKTRLDIGINLPAEKATARLENSGSFSAMVSHRVRIENEKEIDSELIQWLKQAYLAATR